MSQEPGTPVFSWNEAETVDQDEQEDFLTQPAACPLNPDGLESCEACQ